jgi:cobalt/nickel transport system permease protein
MQHSFLDRYSDIDSPIHRLDPRTKFVCLNLFILAVVTTPPDRFINFGAYAALILIAISLSRVPFTYVIKRVCLILPFVLLTALFLPFWAADHDSSTAFELLGMRLTLHGLMLVWNVTIKSLLAALGMILLSSSTPFNSLLKGLESLRFPRIMLMILAFMYRYLFVIVDQALRMTRARQSRGSGQYRKGQVRTIINLIGLLFIRAYERAERVYQCMVCRGFEGDISSIRELEFSPADYIFAGLFLSGVIAIRLAGMA